MPLRQLFRNRNGGDRRNDPRDLLPLPTLVWGLQWGLPPFIASFALVPFERSAAEGLHLSASRQSDVPAPRLWPEACTIAHRGWG